MITPKVTKFRRSLTFANHNPTSKPTKSLHVRSISLPCSSHPLISHLKTQMASLNSWATKTTNPTITTRTSTWLVDGLNQLRTIHEYLDDILQLPQTQDSLRHQSLYMEKLLEALLSFIDVFGTFQGLILALRQQYSVAQMSLRRRDESKVFVFLKDLKKIGKEMGELVSTVRLTGKSPEILGADADLGDVIGGVIEATVMVSVSLFNGISVPFLNKTKTFKGMGLLKYKGRGDKGEGSIEEFEQMVKGLREKVGDEEMRMMVLKKMKGLESLVIQIESCSERVFRGLINTRVSLLNVLTN